MEYEQQDAYHVSLMRTLWQYMYSGTVFDAMDHYVARIRVILGVPLDRSEVPANAPEAQDFITVLVEDTVLTPGDVIDFETALSKIIVKKAASPYFHPAQCMFFYPSPADAVPSGATENAPAN